MVSRFAGGWRCRGCLKTVCLVLAAAISEMFDRWGRQLRAGEWHLLRGAAAGICVQPHTLPPCTLQPFQPWTVASSNHGPPPLLQRNSISPAEREKYRPRSPPEPEHKKMKKEEKDCHVSTNHGATSVTSKILSGQRIFKTNWPIFFISNLNDFFSHT